MDSDKKWNQSGAGIALGIVFGVVVGQMMDNLALGIALGLALGVAIDAGRSRSTREDQPQERREQEPEKR